MISKTNVVIIYGKLTTIRKLEVIKVTHAPVDQLPTTTSDSSAMPMNAVFANKKICKIIKQSYLKMVTVLFKKKLFPSHKRCCTVQQHSGQISGSMLAFLFHSPYFHITGLILFLKK